MKTYNRTMRQWILAAGLLVCLTSFIQAEVSMKDETVEGQARIRLNNGRIDLAIVPALGGVVISYRDKLGGDIELVPPQRPCGLFLDHFQSQLWPGEMYGAPYEVTDRKQDPGQCAVSMRYLAKGEWGGPLDEKLKDLVLEKTYILKADSPALECRIKLTAPKTGAKLFAYWQQHILYAGGQFDRMADKTFRPSTRGIRVKARDQWGHTGMEDFLRDSSAGWMALLDTQRKYGVVSIVDYNELDSLYVCEGNTTIEPMFRITYLPATQSVEYVTWVVPVVGLDNVVSATPDYIAAYTMTTDGKGAGKLSFSAHRSVNPPASLSMKVRVKNVQKPDLAVEAGTATFDPLSETVQNRELSFSGAGEDPLLLDVEAESKTAKPSVCRFEEYFNGVYRWGENIQTDMVTPVYRGERPKQKLTLRKPDPLKLKDVPGVQIWYAEGFLDNVYRIADSAHIVGTFRDGNNKDQRDIVYTSYSPNWKTQISSFPYDYDRLLSYDLMIIGGLKQESLGIIGIEMLGDYLKAGGGMIVLGGFMAYGNSHLQGTDLAEMWPVTMAPQPFDLVKLNEAPLTVADPDTKFIEDLNWKDSPRVLYIHKVDVKPWGKTILEAGGHPFLVVGEIGPNKARVACIMGVPMGTFSKNQVAFWAWNDWSYLMRQLCWWVMKQDHRFNPSW